ESLRAQAEAWLWSRQPGSREKALRALAQANQIRSSPDVRDRMIATLALADPCPLREWNFHRPTGLEVFVGLDPSLERYATADADGNTIVRDVADDRVRADLRRAGPRPQRVWHEFSPDGRYLAVLA